MGLILGMDTGGTFTDAVLFDQDSKKIIRKAKAPTTKEDLCIGLRESIAALAYKDLSEVDLVCISTTLATNSIVEGKGCRVGLAVTGKMPSGVIPDAEIVTVGGSFDIRGRLHHELDENYVKAQIETLRTKVDAVAVSGYACVRNPEHELTVKKIIREELQVPVVCAHELTCELGYYERTVTAVLNAKLIPLIKRLIEDTRICLHENGIDAPIMVVRGDGSYMDSEYAMERPVETILSGPAASIKGAMFLSDLQDGTIIDVGGTTSDIAMLRNGKVDLSMEGAQVGGWRTRVKAVDVFTCGLGGDSRITVDQNGEIHIGPDKVIPASYAASKKLSKTINTECLTEQDREYRNLFGMSNGYNDIGFTPTDMAHILGLYNAWDRKAAERYLYDLAQRMNISGEILMDRLLQEFREAILNALRNSEKLVSNCPIVALGAPSEAWMPLVLKDSEYQLVVPEHSEVANAVGAAIGEIEEVVEILIRQDELTGNYIGYSKWQRKEFTDLENAKTECMEDAKTHAIEQAQKCGCDAPELMCDLHDVYLNTYDGKRKDYIETVISVVAVGAPTFLK